MVHPHDFTTYLPSPLRQHARMAIAARRTRLAFYDPPAAEQSPVAIFDESDDDARRLAGIALVEQLMDEFGAPSVASWVSNLAALRGEDV